MDDNYGALVFTVCGRAKVRAGHVNRISDTVYLLKQVICFEIVLCSDPTTGLRLVHKPDSLH